MKRKIVGFMIAPGVAAAAAALFFGLRNSSIDMAADVYTACCFAGYVGAFLVALPVSCLRKYRNRADLAFSLLLAVMTALVLCVVASVILNSRLPWHQGLLNLCSVALPVSFVAGVSFWLVVRRAEASRPRGMTA
jgi:hypothetical protein